MYWQVYLHKTVISAEQFLIKIFERAKYLANKNIDLVCSPVLKFFLYKNINKYDFISHETSLLNIFAQLDDNDVISAIKSWTKSKDKLLSLMCNKLINRKLLKVKIQNEAFSKDELEDLKTKFSKQLKLTTEEINYLVFSDEISNKAYSPKLDNINILYKDQTIKDITDASDILKVGILDKTVKKYYLCYPHNEK